jgi:branched-chain amino acid transport system permease protein
VLGPLFGAGILTWLPNLFQNLGKWQLFAYGALLALVMFVMPRGIVGTARIWLDKFRNRDASGGRASGAWPNSTPRIEQTLTADFLAGQPLLTLEKVTLRFGGLVAVNAVSETIRAGTVHAIIGPNGAGKTSVLNAISGFYVPTEGSITFAGAQIGGQPSYRIARKGLTRTFQNTELFGDMTVTDNIRVGLHTRATCGLFGTVLRLPGFFRDERMMRERAGLLLDYVGLSAYADELARNLPFGHQRRLEIARALAAGPKILLLDEPAAGLTHGEVEDLVRLIRDLKRLGLTIILVEHHVEMIMDVSDQVTVLDYGEVIASGPPAAIARDPKVIEAYFGGAVAEGTTADALEPLK